MRRLFHLTGRAWSFIAANLRSDNFVLTKCSDVPRFLSESEQLLGKHGRLIYRTQDITGCFPNMPKAAIELAMTSEVHKLEQHGYTGVRVPKASSKPCSFNRGHTPGTVWFHFEELTEIMHFALHHTMLVDHSGALWRQRLGIPMGDPHSPGITNTTCAWMEDEWLQTVGPEARQLFRAVRFMDDILTVHPAESRLAARALMHDLQHACYWPPLELEEGREGTFLETSFAVAEGGIRFWLKNDNKTGDPPSVWRYAHYHSHGSFAQKKATLLACLRKVHHHASDDAALYHSARQKLAEYDRLQYPHRALRCACTALAVSTRNTMWFRVQDALRG